MAMDALITNSLMVMINNEEANDIERLENPTIPSLESSSLLQSHTCLVPFSTKRKRERVVMKLLLAKTTPCLTAVQTPCQKSPSP